MLKLKPKAKRRGGDIYLLDAVVLLSLIGCVFIYSASSYSAESTYGDAFYFVKKQAIGIALGIVAMLFTANFHYEKLKKIAWFFAIAAVILLALVFVALARVFVQQRPHALRSGHSPFPLYFERSVNSSPPSPASGRCS